MKTMLIDLNKSYLWSYRLITTNKFHIKHAGKHANKNDYKNE